MDTLTATEWAALYPCPEIDVSPKDYNPDMKSVWKEVLRDEAKAYCRLALRLAKRTDDWKELSHVSNEMRSMMERAQQIENLFAEESRHRNDGKASNRWFITINPPSDSDPNVLWRTVMGYLEKNEGKSIAAYHAVIEQRSEDPESPKGWHMHVCVQYSEELSRSILHQRLRPTMRTWWPDDVVKAKLPDGKRNPKKATYENNWVVCVHLGEHHRKYVQGEKQEEKMAKVRADKIARERYGFPEFASGSEKIFPSEDIENGISPLPPQTSSDASAPPV